MKNFLILFALLVPVFLVGCGGDGNEEIAGLQDIIEEQAREIYEMQEVNTGLQRQVERAEARIRDLERHVRLAEDVPLSDENDLVFSEVLSFTDGEFEKNFTIREIYRDGENWIASCEIRWGSDEIKLWGREFFVHTEAEHLFAMHRHGDSAYFVYTRISHSDWGYFRTDSFFTVKDWRVEETRFGVVWNEITGEIDPYTRSHIIDERRRFYINSDEVSEAEYRRALGELGLELQIVTHRHEWSDGHVYEWHVAEIHFSDPICFNAKL